MKRIMIIIAIALGISLNAGAQNKNVTSETKTTTVKVDDGTGKPKTVTKTQNVSTQQNIELKDANSKKLNKDIKDTPVQVTSSTTIQGDGIPTYYEMNGQRYIFVTDKTGYKISSPTIKDYGVVRKTSDGHYIYRTKTATSVGYFNENGEFVVESYDDGADGITVETYTPVKP
jgi:hypothetical protein